MTIINKHLFYKLLDDNKTSISELAEELNISQTALYDRIRGARNFKMKELLFFIKKFQLSGDEFLHIFFNL